MNVPELLPLATGTATLVGAGVAGVVAHLTTRRTTLTTWRAKTAEWQYEALTAFHDVALDIRDAEGPEEGRRDRLDAAWRRLELTGPESLVNLARPLYIAAREMAHDGLWAWRDLAASVGRQHAQLANELENDQAPAIALVEAESAAERLHAHLDGACSEGIDVSAVRAIADEYDRAEYDRTGGGIPFGAVGQHIATVWRLHGDPAELGEARMKALERFDKAVGAFTSGMRKWLNGRNPEAS